MTLDSSDLLTTRVSCSNTQSPTALSDSSCYKCLREENSDNVQQTEILVTFLT